MTNAERFKRVESLFDDVVALEPSKRDAFLDSASEGDQDLADEVRRLLSHDTTEGSFLDRSAEQAFASIKSATSPPERVGNYSIKEVLGEGGMGVVYRAEQERPKRDVALKIIRPGPLTERTIRRFEFETSVLGRLDHPGIGRIYESGFDNGRPFFAMELIDGENLIDFADQARLGVRERMELFAEICDAVQYAHSKGVLHRDLKPSNILVDASGRPRILDFGIARSLESDITAFTAQTEVGQLVGTLPYMSPEQLSGDSADVDTRADIYALGVTLYQLLAGRLPHDLTGSSIADAAVAVRDREPPRLGMIDRALRGDPETIVQTAMAKDRARRYQTAADLGADIRRYLKTMPILARPPSAAYLLKRFADRNRPVVAAGALATLALALGLVIATVGFARATESARRAELEASKAREINRVLVEDLLGAAAPEQSAAADDITVIELLDRATEAIDQGRIEQPEVETAVRLVLADTYLALGKFGKSEIQWRASLELIDNDSDASVNDWTRAMVSLATTLQYDGRIAEAEQILRDAIGRCEADGCDIELLAGLQNGLAEALIAQGHYSQGADMHERTLAVRQEILGRRHEDTLETLNNLGAAKFLMGNFHDAEKLFRECYEGRRDVLGEEHPLTALTLGNLALTLKNLGKLDDAQRMYERVYEIDRRVLGDRHPETLTDLHNFAVLLNTRGRFDEAVERFREVVTLRRDVLGSTHPALAYSLRAQADALRSLGRPDEAAPLLAEALKIRETIYTPSSAHRLDLALDLAEVLRELGRPDQALDVLRSQREANQREPGGDEATERIEHAIRAIMGQDDSPPSGSKPSG